MMSCGFEYTVRGWGVTGFQAFPLFTLEGGHNASVRCVRCAPGGAAFCCESRRRRRDELVGHVSRFRSVAFRKTDALHYIK